MAPSPLPPEDGKSDGRRIGNKSLDGGADILSALYMVAGGTPALQQIEHFRIIFTFFILTVPSSKD